MPLHRQTQVRQVSQTEYHYKQRNDPALATFLDEGFHFKSTLPIKVTATELNTIAARP
jgi:hypothetical protein